MECEVGGERRRRRQRGEGQFIRKPFMSGKSFRVSAAVPSFQFRSLSSSFTGRTYENKRKARQASSSISLL